MVDINNYFILFWLTTVQISTCSPILYPELSGFLVSGWLPEKRNNFFLIDCAVMVLHCFATEIMQ